MGTENKGGGLMENDENMLKGIVQDEMHKGFKFYTANGQKSLDTPMAIIDEVKLNGRYVVEPLLQAGGSSNPAESSRR